MNVFHELEVESNELILIPTFHVSSSSSLDEPGKLHSKIATWRAVDKICEFSQFLFLSSMFSVFSFLQFRAQTYRDVSKHKIYFSSLIYFHFNISMDSMPQSRSLHRALERWWNVNKNLIYFEREFFGKFREKLIFYSPNSKASALFTSPRYT